MRIATWNVNSVRSRIDRVVGVLERHDLDVLLLQETKCRDDQFPALALEGLGYEYVNHGLSQWNGVCIISRVGLDDIERGFTNMPPYGDPPVAEARALGATCGGVRVWSLYVPNGREVGHDHYHYKLDWLKHLASTGAGWLADDDQAQVVLGGDWNIAPEDVDVWDMSFFQGSTHVTDLERAAFTGVVDAGFADLVREHTPGEFTYWDYKMLAFPKKRGMRIDFLLGSPAVAARVTGASIDREERKGKGASDHAPVIVDLSPAG